MRLLVTAASRHGATAEIADAIGRRLEAHGLEVDVRPAEQVDSLDQYGAVVLGSAVYVGRWREPALKLVEEHGEEFQARPTWLFSSGPVGVPPKPEPEAAVDIDGPAAATGPRQHRLFPGRIDRNGLGLGERAIVLALRVPEGDFRDWEEIEAWADEIAGAVGAGARAERGRAR